MDLNRLVEFRQGLYAWYGEFHRELPWRDTCDPYRIWLSEVILQQTRVVQGMDYYHRFLQRFPTLADLAHASSEEVFKMWEGLGYYRRARFLHSAAIEVVERYGGIFPSTYREIRSLPGVGAYTAAAVGSFAFDLPVAAVDGNVLRVLSRLWASETPIDTSQGAKLYQGYADALLDPSQPALHNQSMIELGALVCLPSQPRCPECPVARFCTALNAGIGVETLPIKKGKIAVKTRYLHYYLPLYRSLNNEICIPIAPRNEGDIWASLYEFPLIETTTPTAPSWEQVYQTLGIDSQEVEEPILWAEKQHKLTHRLLQLSFTLLPMKPGTQWSEEWGTLTPISSQVDLPAFPVPLGQVVQTLIEKYIHE